MNVAYPLVDAEVLRFCAGKRAVLLVEEGQPNFIEQNIASVLRQADLQTALHGKDMLPMAGEYTAAELLKGVRAFLRALRPGRAGCRAAEPPQGDPAAEPHRRSVHAPPAGLLHRLPRAADLQPR